MTLLRKGRDPRPIVHTCNTCGALNEFEIEAGDKPSFYCGHCGSRVSFDLGSFYDEEEKQDDHYEQNWHDKSERKLKNERS